MKMLKKAKEIIDNIQNYKVCNKCNSVNSRNNDVCISCKSNDFRDMSMLYANDVKTSLLKDGEDLEEFELEV